MRNVLTVPEVAEELRLSANTGKRLLRRGQLKGVRIGPYGGTWRVSPSAIEDFLRGPTEGL